MLFPLSSVPPRVFSLSSPLLLWSSHDVSGGSRVKSSEETLIGSDFSLSLSCHLSPLLYSRPSPLAPLTFSSRVRRSGSNGRENISACVPFVGGRIPRRILDFCTFFPRRSSISADPFPFGPSWCPASLRSLTMKFSIVSGPYVRYPIAAPFRLFFQYLSTVSRFSNSYAILHKCTQFILILMCHVL